MRGILRIGTPLVITVGGLVELGKVTSIQSNHKELQQAGKGTTAAIKVRFHGVHARALVAVV